MEKEGEGGREREILRPGVLLAFWSQELERGLPMSSLSFTCKSLHCQTMLTKGNENFLQTN